MKSYREESGMIKFYGLGGEIGITTDQIQSILKAGESERQGMFLPGVKGPPPLAAPEGKLKVEGSRKTPEKRLARERAKEEREYQRRVKEITRQIEAARDRYSLATRGSSGPEPSLLNSREAIRARTDDLISRLKDAQHNPGRPSDAQGFKLLTPSPFSGAPPRTRELRPGQVVPRVRVPPPTYTKKQRELSELRHQLNQLQRERNKLIEQMNQKNFETGSFFLE